MPRDATSAAEWQYQNELSRQEAQGEFPTDATIRSARFVMHTDCPCANETGSAKITCQDCCGLGIRTIVVPFERIIQLAVDEEV